MKKIIQRALPLILLLALVYLIYNAAFKKPIYRFPDLSGPAQEDVVKLAVPATLADYAAGDSSRVAILVTDPKSDWLGLAHGLKTIGVPFVVTDKHEQAVRHKMVLVYPAISGRLLSRAALQALAAHPQHGGTLVGFDILGGGLHETFGFSESAMLRTRSKLTLDKAFAATFLNSEAEADIALSGPEGGMPTHAFTLAGGKAMASYDDGGVALVRRDFPNGRAIAVGFDLGAYLAKAYNGRQDFGRSYVNAYEPAVDTILRMLLKLYQTAEPLAITLSTVPEGRAASVIITHDIDFTRSMNNAAEYARYERAQGIAATYFVQTKYVRDWNDEIFFNEEGARLTRELLGMGMEVGSHSVSHSGVFSKFPMGSGAERYPDYVPFVKSKTEASDGTLLGELRVSRFLLESARVGAKVSSFRPGHLQYPFALPQAMQASGYRYSSSISSGTALTHLPFQLNVNRENAAETNVFEFPVTIEDELERPMTARIDKALAILGQLEAYGGMCVVLIHPDVLDDKLAFLKSFVGQAKGRDVWFGSLEQFGNWWVARNQAGIDVRRQGAGAVAEIMLPAPIAGLALDLPPGWKLAPSQTGAAKVRQRGGKLLLDAPAGKLTLDLERG